MSLYSCQALGVQVHSCMSTHWSFQSKRSIRLSFISPTPKLQEALQFLTGTVLRLGRLALRTKVHNCFTPKAVLKVHQCFTYLAAGGHDEHK